MMVSQNERALLLPEAVIGSGARTGWKLHDPAAYAGHRDLATTPI